MEGTALYKCWGRVAHEDWIVKRDKQDVSYSQIHAQMSEICSQKELSLQAQMENSQITL